jgi:hypothetical protein
MQIAGTGRTAFKRDKGGIRICNPFLLNSLSGSISFRQVIFIEGTTAAIDPEIGARRLAFIYLILEGKVKKKERLIFISSPTDQGTCLPLNCRLGLIYETRII